MPASRRPSLPAPFPSPEGATFDPSQTYRYRLWRCWQEHAARVVFVMLNPSTADGTHNDPTIRRCLGFAQSWGFGSLEVVNLFAYRTPDPAVLRQVRDPVGAENDFYLQAAIAQADQVLLAWGNSGSLQGRDRTVLQLLHSRGDRRHPPLHCLGLTRAGQPRHPLYAPGSLQPILFEFKQARASAIKIGSPDSQNC